MLLNRLKLLYTAALLLISASSSAAALQCSSGISCQCPDMSQYKNVLPEGWHSRFNEKINPDSSNSLQVVIFEQVDKKGKNNFYCRYINDAGITFVLSTSVSVVNMKKAHEAFWKYDKEDHLWECHPQVHKGADNIAQCAFNIKK